MTKTLTDLKRKSIVVANMLSAAKLNNIASKILGCSTVISTIIDNDTHKITHNINLCHNRFCPICAAGKQINQTTTVKELLTDMQAQNQPIYATALTLTVKNVDYTDPADEINNLKKSFRKIVNRKFFKAAVLGYMYFIQITFRADGSCHPHMHIIIFSRNKAAIYISKYFWETQWQSATGVTYTPQINVASLTSISDIVSYVHYCNTPMDISDVDNNILASIAYQLKNK